MRRPVIWLTVAVVALLALAAPVLVMKTGSTNMTARYLPSRPVLQAGLGHPRPRLLAWARPIRCRSWSTARPPRPAVKQRHRRARGGHEERRPLRPGADHRRQGRRPDADLDHAWPATRPATPRRRSSSTLRTALVPGAFAGSPAKVYVTGNTAFVVDYLAFFHTWLPIALTVVLSLSFVLLLVAFRSVVIPAKAIAMNLLSVGASYGLLVLVFQKGVGRPPARPHPGRHDRGLGAAVSLQPAVRPLHGLPGLPAQPHQGALRPTGDTREAVAYGVGRTASIITGAAAIMVCVFAGMAARPARHVPADGLRPGRRRADRRDGRAHDHRAGRHELLGDWNWYLPRWLEWLPNVSVEGRAPDAGSGEAREGSGAEKPVWRTPVTGTPAVERVRTD